MWDSSLVSASYPGKASIASAEIPEGPVELAIRRRAHADEVLEGPGACREDLHPRLDLGCPFVIERNEVPQQAEDRNVGHRVGDNAQAGIAEEMGHALEGGVFFHVFKTVDECLGLGVWMFVRMEEGTCARAHVLGDEFWCVFCVTLHRAPPGT